MLTGTQRRAPINRQWIEASVSAEQVRSLHSVPLVLVPAAGVDTLVLPVEAFVAFKASNPAVPFEGAFLLRYTVGDLFADTGQNPDGAASVCWWDDNLHVFGNVDNDGFAITDFIGTSALNAPLLLTSDADVTGGDGMFSIMLDYRIIDFTGRI